MFPRLALLGATFLIVGAGCKPAQTLGDAAVLSRELRAEYHRPVAVTLDGRRRLIVTLEADSAVASDGADSAGVDTVVDSASSMPAAQAYRVARFIGAHYDHAGTLRALTVIIEPSPGDSAGEPTISTFSTGEFAPENARPVPPGTKSD